MFIRSTREIDKVVQSFSPREQEDCIRDEIQFAIDMELISIGEVMDRFTPEELRLLGLI